MTVCGATVAPGNCEKGSKIMKCGICRNTGPEITVAHVRTCTGSTASNTQRDAEERGEGARLWCAECAVHVDEHAKSEDMRYLANHPTVCGTLRDDVEPMPLLPIWFGSQGGTWPMWVKAIRTLDAEDPCNCAARVLGNSWHTPGCPLAPKTEETVEVPGLPGVRVPAPATDNPWATVNDLRKRVAEHLPYETRGMKIGRFALRVPGGEGDLIKFYRVKQLRNGRVYVDAQASSDMWPVKTPASLTEVLTGILQDPQGAATLYGQKLNQCYACGRLLTDEISRALGIGPDCRSK